MAKMVTVNLFDVDWDVTKSQRLRDTLDEYLALSIGQRWRNDIRMEAGNLRPADPGRKLPERYVLDFAKQREVGPGKLGHAAPIAGIQMSQGESFGEETAAIYVPAKKWLLVLHNQFGIGSARIAEYFNALDPGSSRHLMYSIHPRLDPTTMARLNGMKNLVSVEVNATVDALDATQSTVGVAVAAATKPAGTNKLSIKFSANATRQKTHFLNARSMVSMVKKLATQNSGVSVLRVKGEDPSAGTKDQVIDLIEHKLKRKYRADELAITNNRYTPGSRWDMLERALIGWL